jgi:hypothetical protein
VEPAGPLLRPSGAGAGISPMWERNHNDAIAEPKRQRGSLKRDHLRGSQRRRAGGAQYGRGSSFDPTLRLSDN